VRCVLTNNRCWGSGFLSLFVTLKSSHSNKTILVAAVVYLTISLARMPPPPPPSKVPHRAAAKSTVFPLQTCGVAAACQELVKHESEITTISNQLKHSEALQEKINADLRSEAGDAAYCRSVDFGQSGDAQATELAEKYAASAAAAQQQPIQVPASRPQSGWDQPPPPSSSPYGNPYAIRPGSYGYQY